MKKLRSIVWVLVLILCLFLEVQAVPKAFTPSAKYVATGLFTVVSSPSAVGTVSNTLTVTFPSNPKSTNIYQIGFGLHSLDIKFDMLRMQFDLQIMSTSTTGFSLSYSSLRGDLVSLLKICYIVKQPSYTDLFYIQTYRNFNPFTIIYNFSPPKQFAYPITPSLPAGSLATIKQRTFLNAWDFSSTISTTDNNVDVYPSTSFPDESTLKVKFQMMYDNVQVAFYSVTVVFWVDGQVAGAGFGQYTVREVDASIFRGQNDANLVINTSPLQMLQSSTYLGIKTFHARTLQTPNFLNFETTFTSTTQVKFPSLNRINWKYMKFQILIIEAKQCPTTHPYFMTNVQDCVASCPPGYVINVDLCVANLGLVLETMQKVPGTDRLEMMFKLDTNDPSFNGLYGQINWNSAASVDIMNSGKQVTYIPSPYPQLKVVVDYTEDIWQKDKIVTIGGYDPVIYPNNFTDFTAKTFPLPKIDSKICPSTHPNWDITAKDCVATCPIGYISVNSKCTPKVDLQLQSISKVPDRNTVQMQFKLSPSDPSFTPLYNQINWNNAVTLDIQSTSKQVIYESYPDPHLVVTLDYSSDIEQLDKTITISAYDPLLYPNNFVDFQAKLFQIPKVSSANGLALNYYSDVTYRTSSYLAYFAIALIALYLTLFALGFIFGKVYILQMSIVPQVAFLSLTTLKTLPPTMASLKLLKYIFGYSYSQQTQAGPLTLDQNRLSQWGVSQYFVYNFNVMLGLLILTYLVLLGVYVKSRQNNDSQTENNDKVNWKKRKNFLLFQVPLYFVLWYGLWIVFAGELQMKYLGSDSLNKLMGFMGLTLFLLCLIVFSLYFGLYSRRHTQFKAFYDALGQPQSDSKMKYFYLSYFIQKLLIGSLVSNLYTQKFTLYIIIGLNLVMVVIIAILRPYNISNNPKQQQSCLRSSIRPILNYLILMVILVLFLVTNQIQVKEGSFGVNVPVIVLCLMFVHVVMTVGFLVVDGVLRRDLGDFREVVMGGGGKYAVEEGDESERRVTGVKEIMGQSGMQGKQGKQGDMSNNKQRSISQSINGKQHPSHNTPTHPSNQPQHITPPQQLTYKPLKQPLQQQQHLSVQQMLTLMAEKNQSQYQKQHSPLNHLTQRQQRTSSKRLHKQIMSSQPSNNVKLLNMISEWKELEDVDSKRMDKLMQVNSRGEQRQGDRKGDESKVIEDNIRKSYQSKAKVFQEYFSRNGK